MAKKKTILEVLVEARALLAKRGAWCKKSAYRDENGHPCDLSSAKSFCALGALEKVLEKEVARRHSLYSRCRTRLVASLTEPPFVDEFNDAQRTKGPVLKLFDRAIAAEQAKRERRAAK